MIAALTDLLLACPTCAQNPQGGGTAFWWVLAAMVLLPYPTVAAVIYAVRRAEKNEKDDTP